MNLNNVEFIKTEFDIQNQTTAEMYVKSVIGKFVMNQIVGTNFTQPLRVSPKVVYNQKYIQITDATKME